MSINWKIAVSATLVAALAYLVSDLKRLDVAGGATTAPVTTQEPTVAVVTPAVVEVEAEPELITEESEYLYLDGVNYLSVEEAFEATEQKAFKLLEDYKFHLANDSPKSHFDVFRIKMSCMGLNLYTQRELDDWMAREAREDRGTIPFDSIEMMARVARCREVVAFIGDEEIADLDQTLKSLLKSAEMGHPIGKLLMYKNSDHKEMAAMFTDAYEYAKKFPQYKSEVYGTALRYIPRDNMHEPSPTYLALFYMSLRDGFIFNEVVDPKDIVTGIQESLEEEYLPLDLDAIHQRRKEISKAMENGDWSWLLSEN